MSIIYTDAAPIFATTSSRRTDGVILDSGAGAGAANRFVLGRASGGDAVKGHHALLRFATGALIATTYTIVQARMKIKAETRSAGGGTLAWYLWASNFTAGTPVVGDYNKVYNNTRKASDVSLRIPLGTLFAVGGTVADTTGIVAVPNRFLKKGGTLISDFEVRPYKPLDADLGTTDTLTLYGTDAAVAANRPYITLTAYTEAELNAENPYRFMATGATAWVAFTKETSPGNAMKASVLIDVTNSSLDSQAVNLHGESLNRQRTRPRKVAIGREGAMGSFSFLLTPEKWTRLLPGIVKYVGTEDVSALYGGTNPGLVEHNFRVADITDIKTFTFVKRRGTFRNVYPGSMIGSLVISASLDSMVSATVDVHARSEWNYDPDAAGINDANILQGSAGYDTVENSNLSFTHAKVSFGNDVSSLVSDRLVRNVTLSLNQEVQEKRALQRTRSVQGHYPLSFSTSVSFDLYFENEVQFRKYLGDRSKDFPFKPGYTIELQGMELAIAGSGGASGYYCTDEDTARQEIIFTIPKMLYSVASKPVNGQDAIMLNCQAVALYDETTQTVSGVTGVENGAIMIKIRNVEAASVFTDLTEDIVNLITVKPAESPS